VSNRTDTLVGGLTLDLVFLRLLICLPLLVRIERLEIGFHV